MAHRAARAHPAGRASGAPNKRVDQATGSMGWDSHIQSLRSPASPKPVLPLALRGGEASGFLARAPGSRLEARTRPPGSASLAVTPGPGLALPFSLAFHLLGDWDPIGGCEPGQVVFGPRALFYAACKVF